MSRALKGKPDRDTMLDHAETLFAERGFGACSLRDVIGAMGCSTTAFYARFGSKEDVFEELVGNLVADLHASAATALASVRSVDDGVNAGVSVLTETLIPRKPLVAVVFSEGNAIAGIRTVLRESFTLLAQLIEAQLTLIGAPDPHGRAWALVGAIHMHVLRWSVYGDVDDDELGGAVRASTAPFLLRET